MVADSYRLPVPTLKEMRARRANDRAGEKGPVFYKIGRAVRYRASDVEAWLNEKKVA
jgi:hypothetical protein